MSLIKEFEKNGWSEVCNRVIGAVVFIDISTAECLHWNGGVSLLLNSGAIAVRSLTPFEAALEDQKKAVFITELTFNNIIGITNIIKRSKFTQCVLISTTSLTVIYSEYWATEPSVISAKNAAFEAEKNLKAQIVEWMECKKYLVEVIYIPIFTLSLTNHIFLIPRHNEVFPLYKGNFYEVTSTSEPLEFTNEDKNNMQRLTSDINALVEVLQMKEDVHFIGFYSSMVASYLEKNPAHIARKKSCTKQATLIIIDRTLDLGSVTSHSMETVLDKIMAILPKFPEHGTDIAVNMSPLCRAKVTKVEEDVQICPGSLYHPNDNTCIEMLDRFINEPYKEALLALYQNLSKLDVARSPVPLKLVKVTPQSIDKVIALCKENYELIEKNVGILQQSLAVHQMLTSPILPQIELLHNLEKQILENIATCGNSTSVLLLICTLIKNRKAKNVDLINLLTLLVFVYNLSGEDVQFNPIHEKELEDLLAMAIYEDYDGIAEVFDRSGLITEDVCKEIATNIILKLRDVSIMRSRMESYESVIKKTETGVEYDSVLRQVLPNIVSSGESVDFNQKSEGLKDYLRTGLTMFGKNRPSKKPFNTTVIIFIVGGVTPGECRRLRNDIVATGYTNVLIGSTKLATPNHIVYNLFKHL